MYTPDFAGGAEPGRDQQLKSLNRTRGPAPSQERARATV